MAISQTPLPGRYRHHKGETYYVRGIAAERAKAETDDVSIGMAILAGTEDDDIGMRKDGLGHGSRRVADEPAPFSTGAARSARLA